MPYAPRGSMQLRPLKPPTRNLKAGGYRQSRSIIEGVRSGAAGMPGVGEMPPRAIAPRHQLPFGGSTLTNRVQVLVDQVRSTGYEVKRAAVQELCLLASSSEACRLAILSGSGDKMLLREVGRTDDPVVLRWCLSALGTLAAEEWSRKRAVGSLGILVPHLSTEDRAVLSVPSPHSHLARSDLARAHEPSTSLHGAGLRLMPRVRTLWAAGACEAAVHPRPHARGTGGERHAMGTQREGLQGFRI